MITPPSFLLVAAASGAVLASLAASSCCASCWGLSSADAGGTTRRLVGYRQVEEVVTSGDAKGGMPTVRLVQQPVYEEVQARRGFAGGGRVGCMSVFFPDHTACGSTGPETIARASAQGANGAPQIGLIPTMRPLAD